ncbi:MAG: hypothetical protein NZM12_03870, partial [Steroidobacteraceae bacterium]|nr:hypothetical protein [Steroidobacteraceae bacterium]
MAFLLNHLISQNLPAAVPSGVWVYRVHLHEFGLCAQQQRASDGIVLIDPDLCMGCNDCAWDFPYGARELDTEQGVMRKCTRSVFGDPQSTIVQLT